MDAPIPARTTVRGFHGTPVTSDEDSDYGSGHGSAQRGRQQPLQALDDVVSANCSPLLRPNGSYSPAVGGIAKLRLQLEPLCLDSAASSRAASPARPLRMTRAARQTTDSRNSSRGGSSGDDGPSRDETSYVIRLENDFVSKEVDGQADTAASSLAAKTSAGVDDDDGEFDPLADFDATTGTSSRDWAPPPPKKMTADDFAPLRCLGKGSYGTVLLVKQHSTGRLYAQKQFKKASLVVHKQLIEQTKTERQILESVNRHPFVVKLFYAFQDREKLYLILEYGQGGELFTHLSAERMFSASTAAFYMAEMVLALAHLHETLGVVYRDLKPENCLLDATGHLMLTDFGLSKVALPGEGAEPADACCKSILGTVEYMAPEVVQGQKYGRAVDWWSLGALGYDLLTGAPPFRGRNKAKIQDNIVRQKLVLPYFLGPDAKDLLTRLLQKNPRKRLGANMPKDLATIQGHRFFRGIDWARLAARELEPPIQPVITDPELAENFAAEFTELPLSPVVSAVDGRWGGSSVSPAAAGLGVGMAAAATMGSGGATGGPGGSGTAAAAGGSLKDDPFGGFSFVASTSLLNDSHFPLRV